MRACVLKVPWKPFFPNWLLNRELTVTFTEGPQEGTLMSLMHASCHHEHILLLLTSDYLALPLVSIHFPPDILTVGYCWNTVALTFDRHTAWGRI